MIDAMRPLLIRLSMLETYLSGLELPLVADGTIRPVSIPEALEFGNVDFYIIELATDQTALSAFPLLVFRTQENALPVPGDVKEVRLYGLSGGAQISLNSYIRGTATILEQ